jgi:hypothetical protein
MAQGTSLRPEFVGTAGLWMYLDCHCVDHMSADGARLTHDCRACGKRDLRFFHILENVVGIDEGLIGVCIECARILIGDVQWDIPGDAEQEAKQRAENLDLMLQCKQ